MRACMWMIMIETKFVLWIFNFWDMIMHLKTYRHEWLCDTFWPSSDLLSGNMKQIFKHEGTEISRLLEISKHEGTRETSWLHRNANVWNISCTWECACQCVRVQSDTSWPSSTCKCVTCVCVRTRVTLWPFCTRAGAAHWFLAHIKILLGNGTIHSDVSSFSAPKPILHIVCTPLANTIIQSLINITCFRKSRQTSRHYHRSVCIVIIPKTSSHVFWRQKRFRSDLYEFLRVEIITE